jgi:CheY-like chemotaxis protein
MREREGHARAPDGASSARAAESVVEPGTRRPILVVDDEPAVLALVVRALRARGHDVRAAASGRDALLAIHGGGLVPAVLVADVDMPGMSGIELAARVAADRPGVAIVLMSRNPAVLDMARDRPELVRGVVAKPPTADAVVGIVEALIDEPGPDREQQDG